MISPEEDWWRGGSCLGLFPVQLMGESRLLLHDLAQIKSNTVLVYN